MAKFKRSDALIFAWIAVGVFALALLFARAMYPELVGLTVVIAVGLLGAAGFLAFENRKSLSGRTAAYGLNSLITIALVVCIVGVLNFLSSRYPYKLDLTKNKVNSLSDQTVRVVKGLNQPIKATYFAKANDQQQARRILDSYKGLNPKFEVEYVDPDRSPLRARQLGVKTYETLHLSAGARDTQIQGAGKALSEEKITNGLIKILNDKKPLICMISGHGEKSINSLDPDGYQLARLALADQSYEAKEILLTQEGKVPDSCNAIAILGPTKSFFPAEVKTLSDYLATGGRAIFTVDLNVKGTEFSPELIRLLEPWQVRSPLGLIVDPSSRGYKQEASVPVVRDFSRESPITRESRGLIFFPFSRPLQIAPTPPASITAQWLVRTTPESWAVTDMSKLTKAIDFDPATDLKGPLPVAVSVEGKLADSKAARKTRLVVFGSSYFAVNQYATSGNNIDLFLNSIAWVLDDKALISIHAKEDGPGRIEMTERSGVFIALFTIIVLPLLISALGIVIWLMRRRM